VFGCPEKNMDRLKLEFYNRLNCGYWVVMRFQSFALLIFSLSKTKWIIVRRAMVLCWYQNIKRRRRRKTQQASTHDLQKNRRKKKNNNEIQKKLLLFCTFINYTYMHCYIQINCFASQKQNKKWETHLGIYLNAELELFLKPVSSSCGL